MERNLVLIGFMGTGKSTIGFQLADRLGWQFVDSDHVIAEREGSTIPELFEHKGEEYFRNVESEVLRETLAGSKQVVSTGGGAVLRPANREIMLSSSFVVALTAPPDVLLARLRGDINRPLLSGNKEERVHQLMEERKNAYDFAHLRIDTSQCNVMESVEIILKKTGLGKR